LPFEPALPFELTDASFGLLLVVVVALAELRTGALDDRRCRKGGSPVSDCDRSWIPVD
jgi:hypothetical protein